jgi:hypothetical protein
MKKSISGIALISIGIILLCAVCRFQNQLSELHGLYDHTVIEETFAAGR